MDEKRKSRPWAVWLVVGLVLLVAYPLSMGPVLYLMFDGSGPSPVYESVTTLYAPLLPLLHEPAANPITSAYQGYVLWWLDD